MEDFPNTCETPPPIHHLRSWYSDEPVRVQLTSPEGFVTSADGAVASPDGSVTPPDGAVASPGGSVSCSKPFSYPFLRHGLQQRQQIETASSSKAHLNGKSFIMIQQQQLQHSSSISTSGPINSSSSSEDFLNYGTGECGIGSMGTKKPHVVAGSPEVKGLPNAGDAADVELSLDSAINEPSAAAVAAECVPSNPQQQSEANTDDDLLLHLRTSAAAAAAVAADSRQSLSDGELRTESNAEDGNAFSQNRSSSSSHSGSFPGRAVAAAEDESNDGYWKVGVGRHPLYTHGGAHGEAQSFEVATGKAAVGAAGAGTAGRAGKQQKQSDDETKPKQESESEIAGRHHYDDDGISSNKSRNNSKSPLSQSAFLLTKGTTAGSSVSLNSRFIELRDCQASTAKGAADVLSQTAAQSVSIPRLDCCTAGTAAVAATTGTATETSGESTEHSVSSRSEEYAPSDSSLGLSGSYVTDLTDLTDVTDLTDLTDLTDCSFCIDDLNSSIHSSESCSDHDDEADGHYGVSTGGSDRRVEKNYDNDDDDDHHHHHHHHKNDDDKADDDHKVDDDDDDDGLKGQRHSHPQQSERRSSALSSSSSSDDKTFLSLSRYFMSFIDSASSQIASSREGRIGAAAAGAAAGAAAAGAAAAGAAAAGAAAGLPSMNDVSAFILSSAKNAADRVAEGLKICVAPRKPPEESAAVKLLNLLPVGEPASYFCLASPVRESAPVLPNRRVPVHYEVLPVSIGRSTVTADVGLGMFHDSAADSNPSNNNNSSRSSSRRSSFVSPCLSKSLVLRFGDVRIVGIATSQGSHCETLLDFILLSVGRRLLERFNTLYQLAAEVEASEHHSYLSEFGAAGGGAAGVTSLDEEYDSAAAAVDLGGSQEESRGSSSGGGGLSGSAVGPLLRAFPSVFNSSTSNINEEVSWVARLKTSLFQSFTTPSNIDSSGTELNVRRAAAPARAGSVGSIKTAYSDPLFYEDHAAAPAAPAGALAAASPAAPAAPAAAVGNPEAPHGKTTSVSVIKDEVNERKAHHRNDQVMKSRRDNADSVAVESQLSVSLGQSAAAGPVSRASPNGHYDDGDDGDGDDYGGGGGRTVKRERLLCTTEQQQQSNSLSTEAAAGKYRREDGTLETTLLLSARAGIRAAAAAGKGASRRTAAGAVAKANLVEMAKRPPLTFTPTNQAQQRFYDQEQPASNQDQLLSNSTIVSSGPKSIIRRSMGPAYNEDTSSSQLSSPQKGRKQITFSSRIFSESSSSPIELQQQQQQQQQDQKHQQLEQQHGHREGEREQEKDRERKQENQPTERQSAVNQDAVFMHVKVREGMLKVTPPRSPVVGTATPAEDVPQIVLEARNATAREKQSIHQQQKQKPHLSNQQLKQQHQQQLAEPFEAAPHVPLGGWFKPASVRRRQTFTSPPVSAMPVQYQQSPSDPSSAFLSPSSLSSLPVTAAAATAFQPSPGLLGGSGEGGPPRSPGGLRKTIMVGVSLTASMIENLCLNTFYYVNGELRHKLRSQSSTSGASLTVLLNQPNSFLIGVCHIGCLRGCLAKEVPGRSAGRRKRGLSRPQFESISITTDHSASNTREAARVVAAGASICSLRSGKAVSNRNYNDGKRATNFVVGKKGRRIHIQAKPRIEHSLGNEVLNSNFMKVLKNVNTEKVAKPTEFQSRPSSQPKAAASPVATAKHNSPTPGTMNTTPPAPTPTPSVSYIPSVPAVPAVPSSPAAPGIPTVGPDKTKIPSGPNNTASCPPGGGGASDGGLDTTTTTNPMMMIMMMRDECNKMNNRTGLANNVVGKDRNESLRWDNEQSNFKYRRLMVRYRDSNNTTLASTRGFGFSGLEEFGFSSVPDLANIQLSPTEKYFIVLASPHIWDTFESSQSVVDFVADQLYLHRKTPEQSANSLVDNVLSFWSLTREDPPGDLVACVIPLQ